MRRTAPSLLLLIFAWACDRNPAQPDVTGPPPEAAAITSVTPLAQMVLGANVAHDRIDADFLRVSYQSSDGNDAGITLWQTPDAASILVLGLLPSTAYTLWIESKRGNQTVAGSRIAYGTAPLPSGLAEVAVHLDGTPSGGYSIANIGAADSHGYIVIFDSTGTLRWYRDFGPQFTSDATPYRVLRINNLYYYALP